jgi:hypothetical protein
MAPLKQQQIDAVEEFVSTTIHALKTDRAFMQKPQSPQLDAWPERFCSAHLGFLWKASSRVRWSCPAWQ